jgi:hypothetical protein
MVEGVKDDPVFMKGDLVRLEARLLIVLGMVAEDLECDGLSPVVSCHSSFVLGHSPPVIL